MSIQELETIVKHSLQGKTNAERKKAETKLHQMKKQQPANYFSGLATLINQSPDSMTRSFAAVLFRQTLGIMDESFEMCPREMQVKIQKLILDRAAEESDRNVVLQLSHGLGALACHVLLAKREWPELMPTLMKLANSQNPQHRESFLIVLDRIAEFACDILRPNFKNVHKMLAGALGDKNNSVRTAALSAVVSLLLSVDKVDELQHFSDMIPLLFKSMTPAAGDNVVAKACENLMQLTENVPEFFEKSMGPITNCLVAVTTSPKLEWQTRRMAYHLLVTLVQFNIATCNPSKLGPQVIPLGFMFINAYDDTIDWKLPEDDVDQTNFQFGGDMLQALVETFGAEDFLKTAQPLITKGFASKQWRDRLTSLAVVRFVLEFCAPIWQPNLGNIVQAAGTSLSHAQPQVRYEALGVIKILAVTFAEQDFQQTYHGPIMQALHGIITDPKQHVCVLIQACDAIAHFSYDCPADLLKKYADTILKGLLGLLKTADPPVQCFAFKAVSVMASQLEDRFTPFYDTFMTFCQIQLQKTQGKPELAELRGRTMECVGQMCGMDLTSKRCKQDAHKTMQYLIPFQKKEREAGTVAYNYMARLFCTLAEALEGEFDRYLSHVIPPLVEDAQLQPTQCTDAAETDDIHDSGFKTKDILTQTLHVHSFGNKRVTVNTFQLEQKKIACEKLTRYVSIMGDKFAAFIEPVSKAMIPLLHYRQHNAIRRSAVECVPQLVQCLFMALKGKNMKPMEIGKACAALLSQVLPGLVDSMQIEDEVDEFSTICENVTALLEIIEDLVDNGGCNAMMFIGSGEIIGEMTQQFALAIQERSVRTENRMCNPEDEESDGEVLEEAEAQLADSLADVVSKLCKLYGEKFVKVFSGDCAKQCTSLFAEHSPEEDQTLGLTLFTETVLYGGETGQKWVPNLFNLCSRVLKNTQGSAGFRQSAAYCVGVMAQTGGLKKAEYWIDLLKKMVNEPTSRSEDNVMCTENAVAAIGKICKYRPQKAQINSNVIMEWILMLPLANDADERQFCNDYILQLMQQNFDSLLKAHKDMPMKLLSVIGTALKEDDKQKTQFQKAYAMMTQKMGGAAVAALVQQMEPSFQTALNAAAKQF